MLAELLSGQVFAFALIFVRIGAALMYLPAYSEPYVPIRVRLIFALLLTMIVLPVIGPKLPEMPESPLMLGLLILGESIIGLFFGLLARAILSALAIAGTVMATMSALANALTNDLTAAQQGSIVASLLSTLGLLLIVLTDLHHMLLRGMVNSYELFTPGQPLPMGSFAEMMAMMVSKAFIVGFQMATPFVALAIVFYFGLGLISRLMPTMQVFFIGLPLKITLALTLLFLTLPMIMHWFLKSFEESIRPMAGY